MSSEPLARIMWRANLGLVSALVICSFTVDMNGEYPLLPRWGSVLLTVGVLGGGIAINACLTVVDPRRRWIALPCLGLFALAALPVFL